MPALNGVIATSALGASSASAGLSPSVSAYQTNNLQGVAYNPASERLNGTKAAGARAMLREVKAGSLAVGFTDLYYERIHVLPARTDLGNVVSDETVSVEVWNAHFSARVLNSIDGFSVDGSTLAGPTSHTFAALESLIYQLTVTLTGPPSFDGYYRFNFTSGEQPTETVTGARVVAWPFSIDSTPGVREVLAWLTDLTDADDGTETRRMLRSYPGRTLEYTFLLEGTERAYFKNLLFGWMDRFFSVPIHFDAQYLTDALPLGATSVPVGTTFKDYDAGQLVMLWLSPFDLEIIEIDSLTADAVILARPTGKSWPAGTKVSPAKLATVAQQLSYRSITNDTDETVIQFKVKDKSVNRLAFAAHASYRGVEVFDLVAEWSDPPTSEITLSGDLVDFGTGPFSIDAHATGPNETHDFVAWLDGRQAIAEFMGWLDTRKGRLQSIYVPTLKDDFELVQDAGATATSLRVKFVGYEQLIQAHPARRDLCVTLTNGTRIFARITGATAGTDLPDGTATEILTLESQIGTALSVGDGHQISYMIHSRLNADTVELAWNTDDLLIVNFKFAELLTSPA